MENLTFRSLEDLYRKLLPALNAKVNELKRDHFEIDEKDIWNYLKNKFWINKSDLTLGEMVNDILTVNKEQLISYLLEKRKISQSSIL